MQHGQTAYFEMHRSYVGGAEVAFEFSANYYDGTKLNLHIILDAIAE
jgi:hypothetical protein